MYHLRGRPKDIELVGVVPGFEMRVPRVTDRSGDVSASAQRLLKTNYL